jgi:D-glycero-D-manno-heptose 1,7-bisphosphate phosphatase
VESLHGGRRETVTKLLLVDLDGTIREPLSGEKFIQHPQDQRIIKGADKAIAYYHSLGWVVIGISNQGGVAAGRKQLSDAIAEAEYTLELFPHLLCIYLCPDFRGNHCWLVPRGYEAKPVHQDWAAEFAGTFRKPGAGMLKAAMKNHGGLDCEKDCWYIGDRSEDEEAAMRAGVQYMDADIWRDRFCTGEYRVNL